MPRTAAKVSHLNLLHQGKSEKGRRVLNVVRQMDKDGFGNCAVAGINRLPFYLGCMLALN